MKEGGWRRRKEMRKEGKKEFPGKISGLFTRISPLRHQNGENSDCAD